jgi:hypothetical protein
MMLFVFSMKLFVTSGLQVTMEYTLIMYALLVDIFIVK